VVASVTGSVVVDPPWVGAVEGFGVVEVSTGVGAGGGPRTAGSIAQVTFVLSVPVITRSRREPVPMALVHAVALAVLSMPNSAGSGSRVSGTSQAMDIGSYSFFADNVGRNVCWLPRTTAWLVASEVVLTTSTLTGRTANDSRRLIAVAGMMRVKATTAPGARLGPSGVLATSTTGCSPAGVAQSVTAPRLFRPWSPMSARAIGASICTELALRTVPEMVIGALGAATSGLMLVRVTDAGPVTVEAVVTAVTALAAMAGGPDATGGETETASKAAQAARRRTCFRFWTPITWRLPGASTPAGQSAVHWRT